MRGTYGRRYKSLELSHIVSLARSRLLESSSLTGFAWSAAPASIVEGESEEIMVLQVRSRYILNYADGGSGDKEWTLEIGVFNVQ